MGGSSGHKPKTGVKRYLMKIAVDEDRGFDPVPIFYRRPSKSERNALIRRHRTEALHANQHRFLHRVVWKYYLGEKAFCLNDTINKTKHQGTETGMKMKSRPLIFESRFQSGNLAQAVQKSEYEYALRLHPDINTKGNIHWFFYSVKNAIPGNTVKPTPNPKQDIEGLR